MHNFDQGFKIMKKATIWLALLGAILSRCGLFPACVYAASYSYDAAGRLLSADYGNGRTLSYAYDDAGNLLSIRNALPSADADADGVRDYVEAQAPDPSGGASGDGNGDGTADASQSAVTSLTGYNVTGYATLWGTSTSTPGYGANHSVQALARDSSISSSIKSPLGMLGGTFTTASAGDALNLRLYLPSSAKVKRLLIKRGSDGRYIAVAAAVSALGTKTVLALRLADGGVFDLDGAVNGRLELVLVPAIIPSAASANTLLLLK